MPDPFISWDESLKRTYSSFTGSDLYAVFGNELVQELLAISVSQTREIAPSYTMGSYKPRGFNKGKFATGGSFTLSFFDRDPLLMRVFHSSNNQVYGAMLSSLYSGGDFLNAPTLKDAEGINMQLSQVQRSSQDALAYATEVARRARGRLLTNPTQIPPFDITVTFLNEAGNQSFCAIVGVQIINTARGWSMDDMTSEQPYTYMAIDATPVVPITEGNQPNSQQYPFSQTPMMGSLSGLMQ